MQAVIDAITWIGTWLANGVDGIGDFFQQAGVWLVAKFVISWIKAKIWLLTFAWSIAKSVLESFQISQHLNAAFSVLPSEMQAFLSFLRIPDAINIIITSFMAKFVMRFIPFA